MEDNIALCLLKLLHPSVRFQLDGIKLRIDCCIAPILLTQLRTKVVDDLVQQLRCCGWIGPRRGMYSDIDELLC